MQEIEREPIPEQYLDTIEQQEPSASPSGSGTWREKVISNINMEIYGENILGENKFLVNIAALVIENFKTL